MSCLTKGPTTAFCFPLNLPCTDSPSLCPTHAQFAPLRHHGVEMTVTDHNTPTRPTGKEAVITCTVLSQLSVVCWLIAFSTILRKIYNNQNLPNKPSLILVYTLFQFLPLTVFQTSGTHCPHLQSTALSPEVPHMLILLPLLQHSLQFPHEGININAMNTTVIIIHGSTAIQVQVSEDSHSPDLTTQGNLRALIQHQPKEHV